LQGRAEVVIAAAAAAVEVIAVEVVLARIISCPEYQHFHETEPTETEDYTTAAI
jgi:hypothetical protein